jgi:hypothetical protein
MPFEDAPAETCTERKRRLRETTAAPAKRPVETAAELLRRQRDEAAALPDITHDDPHRNGDRASGDDEDAAGLLNPRLIEVLVPDPVVWGELGITAMSGWRWSHDPNLGFPVVIKVQGRNFRSRRMLEAFKRALIRKALAGRKVA